MTPEELIAARKALGLKGTELAELMGVGYRTLQQWQAGDRRIPGNIERLLAFMKVVPREQWPIEMREVMRQRQEDRERRLAERRAQAAND